VIGWVTYLVKVSLHLFKRWSPPEKEYWCNQLIEPKEDNHKLCNDIKSKQNVSISVFFVGVGILVVDVIHSILVVVVSAVLLNFSLSPVGFSRWILDAVVVVSDFRRSLSQLVVLYFSRSRVSLSDRIISPGYAILWFPDKAKEIGQMG